MKMIRLTKEERRDVITTAIRRLIDGGMNTYDLTHDNVADACSTETSRHTVKYYFKTKQRLYDVASDYQHEIEAEGILAST